MELQDAVKQKAERPDAAGMGMDGLLSMLEMTGSPACQCIFDQELTLLCANPSFYKSSGYSKEEFNLSCPTLRQYLHQHPGEFDIISQALSAAAEHGQNLFSADCRIPVKTGTFLHVRIHGTITEETTSGCPTVFMTLTDISDLVDQAEQKVQYFEWMMDEYIGNVYISDMDSYELLYINQTAADTLQCTKKAPLGHKCYEIIQGRTEPCPFCTNSRLRTDEFYEWEFDNPLLNRTFMIKNRIIDWNGHRARLELSHDMFSTEYKLAKKDRERDALIRTIPGGLARLDARDCSTIMWYGANFLDIIGYTEEQFENELGRQCTYIHPDDLSRLQLLLEQIRITGESTAFESRIITRDGQVKILTMTFCYASGENSWDGIPSFYSIGIDLTKDRAEQERQKKALEEAYQAARVANSAKTNFLSSMSHDIRTPMNAIMGMAAIAQANLSSPEKIRDCLSKINVSSRHLLSLVNEVLDMSRIESGKIDLTPEEVKLPELIENVFAMCKPLISEKDLQFQISASKVRHETVITDGDRLQQVLINLLTNAVKYTPNGGQISLSIKEIPSLSSQKAQFEFIITDTGIGMSEEFLPHIFEPFSRAEDSRISKIQGTGLGMAITENIVRMMNGSIEVTSRLGEGSQFTVTVQLELVNEEVTDTEELNGLPVLVVDDDQIVCESASALLTELGMRGCWVLSGAEAVTRAEEAHKCGDDFFAVILDWKMPEMDGLETVKVLRKRLGNDVPIIIISAYDYSDIEAEFLQAGADAFISKPLFKSKMLHVLQLFLESGHSTASGAAEEQSRPALADKRILLAEDNELNREIAIELLEMQEIIVEAVENGQEAVEAFRSSPIGYYNAILMDIQMPVMNGYDAAAAIRSLEREDAPSVPILALTANAFTTDIGKAYSVGMNDHIAKPIDVERLITVLERCMNA